MRETAVLVCAVSSSSLFLRQRSLAGVSSCCLGAGGLMPGSITTGRRAFSFGSKPDDGVPLKPGSRMHRIHQWCRAQLNQGMLFHAGKLVTLGSTLTSDWVTVRLILVASSLFSTVFHFLFPDPRPVRMLYGALFALGNLVALFVFLYEYGSWWTLDNAQDEALYRQVFEPHGFSRYQFRTILSFSTYEAYEENHVVVKQGDPMERIFLVVDGEGHFQHDLNGHGSSASLFLQESTPAQREILVRLGRVDRGSSVRPGCWIGEVYDKNYDWSVPHAWRVSFVVTSPTMRVLAVDKRKLHDYLKADVFRENMGNLLQLRDLWRTRRASAEARSLELHQLREELERAIIERNELRRQLSQLLVQPSVHSSSTNVVQSDVATRRSG